ncbi:MAG TPA: hypothetical protein ENK67_07090 [Flavobacteriia bacterium]|nr:hypothetical protein [Flavobacteriia bacterium]
MKKTILTLLAVILVQTSFAQKEKNNDFTPEQQAEIRTKKMQLALDLTNKQVQQIKEIQLDMIKEKAQRKESKENLKELTSDEKYQRIITNLDKKIAVKKRFKAVLNQQQYEKWEKMQKMHRANGKRNMLKKRMKTQKMMHKDE